MTDFKKKKEIVNPDAETFRKELENYFKHVLKHDPKDLRFSVMLAGHEQEDGGIHMCTMVGGQPPMVARAVMELMDVLVKQDPAYGIAFLLNAVSNLKSTGANVTALAVPLNEAGIDLSKFDQTGGDDIAKTVEDFIASLQGGNDGSDQTPPKGNLH